MSQQPLTMPAKTYQPKHTINALQASFLVGILRAKGYVSKEYVFEIVTKLSTAHNFSDITFDEASYLVKRLPRVERAQLDAYLTGQSTLDDIGFAKYDPRRAAKRKSKGAKA